MTAAWYKGNKSMMISSMVIKIMFDRLKKMSLIDHVVDHMLNYIIMGLDIMALPMLCSLA